MEPRLRQGELGTYFLQVGLEFSDPELGLGAITICNAWNNSECGQLRENNGEEICRLTGADCGGGVSSEVQQT